MENEIQEEVVTQVEQKSSLHQVTPLSKYLALALFVILPFLGGWIGYSYAPEKVVEVERVVYVDNVEKTEVISLQEEVNEMDLSHWLLYEDDSSGISFNYPKGWIIDQSFPKSNKQIRFVDNYVSVSFDYLDQSNNLDEWLELNDYFSSRYYNYTYSQDDTTNDSTDTYLSVNSDTYDDAFVHVGDTVFYVRNGVNEYTGIENEPFLAFVRQLTLAKKVNHVSDLILNGCGQQSLLDNMLFSKVYFSENDVIPYENIPDKAPFMYGRGTNCSIGDNDHLISFSYTDRGRGVQAVSRVKGGEIINTFKGEICQTIGDFDSARLLKVSDGKATLYCLSGDAGEIAFGVAKLDIDTFVLEKYEQESLEYSTVFNEVAEASDDLEFWKRYGYPR
ncbi:MAG: hypothetical protein ACI9H6_000566 [Patiriisocius sp.]|jgi:hypothetical protein